MLETQIPQICNQAQQSAREAASKYFNEKLGGKDQFACGFAWVDVYEVRSNSKLGKALIAQGFRKSYSKTLQLWNPSNFGCQNIDTLEEGARAYAEVLKQAGLKAHVGSRLD
jgi:hypothetical protein